MTFRFLIDECLSPELAELAIADGHTESACARDRDLLGKKDWELMEYVTTHDFTLVTHNASDFRGRGMKAPGGLHAAHPVHAGLVCLNSACALDIERQRDLFSIALEHLRDRKDLVNQALEVFERPDGSVTVELYEIPAADGSIRSCGMGGSRCREPVGRVTWPERP